MRWISAVLLLVPLLAAGCASESQYERNLQGWVGRPVGDLVRAWVSPQRITRAADGGAVYEWDWEGTSTIGGFTLPDGQKVQSQTLKRRCRTRITVGRDKIIKSWSIDGNACKAHSGLLAR